MYFINISTSKKKNDFKYNSLWQIKAQTCFSLIALSAVFSLSPLSPSQAEVIDAASTIKNVVLYPDSAVITREITLDLPAGEHVIRLTNLPDQLDPSSLRIEGKVADKTKETQTKQAFTFGAIDFQLVPLKNPNETSDDQKRLNNLKHQRDKLSDVIEAINGRKNMILRLSSQSESQKQGEALLPFAQWEVAWDKIGKGLRAANEELRVLENDAKKIDEEIAALEEKTTQANPSQLKTTLSFNLEATTATKSVLQLSYRVTQTGWKPFYDAQLNTNGDKPQLTLTRRAAIRQNTQEDWRDIRLTLSTLPLTQGTTVPVINGQRLTLEDKMMPKKAFSAPPAPMPMAVKVTRNSLKSEMAVSDSEKIEQDVQELSAELKASNFHSEFVIPQKITLLSGTMSKNLRLNQENITPHLQYKASPALDSSAYLDAEFLFEGEAPLLAGEVTLIRDGAYLGQGRLPMVASGEKTHLGFGADPQVKIKRIPLARQMGQSGIFSSYKEEETQVKTEFHNLHNFAIPLIVEDALPVSEDQAIIVERLPNMSKADSENVEGRRGILRYNFTLAPQQKRDLIMAYRIRWPADQNIRRSPLP